MEILARQLAIDATTELLEAHTAAVESMRILSQSGAKISELAVALQIFHKCSPEKKAGDYKRQVAETVSKAKKLISDDFSYHRGMLLIALCSVLDVSVRRIAAECLVTDPTLVSNFPETLRPRLMKHLRTNLKDREGLEDAVFSVLDREFKTYPNERGISHTKRFRYWLSLVNQEITISLENDRAIDDGYLVRNWMIHGSKSNVRKLSEEASHFFDKRCHKIRVGQAEIAAFATACRQFILGIGYGNL